MTERTRVTARSPNQDPAVDPRDVPGLTAEVLQEDRDGNQVVKLPEGFNWETLSMAIASEAETWPTWFGMTGGGTARILLWSPDHTWEHEEAQVVTLREPTGRAIDAVMRAEEEGSAADRRKAQGDLLVDMVTGFTNLKAARRVKFEGRETLAAGADLLPPVDYSDLLADMEPAFGRDVGKAVQEYVDAELPHRLRAMVHTAAFIMAMPDMSYLRKRKKEKRTAPDVAAEARGEERTEPAEVDVKSDPSSGEDSSGSTG